MSKSGIVRGNRTTIMRIGRLKHRNPRGFPERSLWWGKHHALMRKQKQKRGAISGCVQWFVVAFQGLSVDRGHTCSSFTFLQKSLMFNSKEEMYEKPHIWQLLWSTVFTGLLFCHSHSYHSCGFTKANIIIISLCIVFTNCYMKVTPNIWEFFLLKANIMLWSFIPCCPLASIGAFSIHKYLQASRHKISVFVTFKSNMWEFLCWELFPTVFLLECFAPPSVLRPMPY